MANYDGLSRNEWPSTWSPSADHPIVLDTEIRGGLRYVSGDSGDQFSDITGQRLQDGMLVYLRDSYGAFEGGRYYQYNTTATRDVNDGTLPNNDSNWSLFSPFDSGADVTFNNLTLTGSLKAPSTFFIDPLPLTTDSDGTDSDGKDKGLVVILGNLEVRGTQTTVKSYTLSISDKNIVLADSARDSADADGGGITLNGANASLIYHDSTGTWNFNKPLGATTIKGNLLPSEDSMYDLGSDSNRWRDLYLSGQSINLGGLLIKNKDGVLFVEDSAGNPNNINVGNVTVDSSLTFVDDSGNSLVVAMNDSGDLAVNGTALLTKDMSIGDLSDVDIETGLDSGALLVWDSATQSFSSTRTITNTITFNDGIVVNNQLIADSAAITGFLSADSATFSGPVVINSTLTADSATFDGTVVINDVLTADSATFDGPVVATSFTGEYLGFDSDLGDSDARQTIRSYFSATGGLGYDSSTGVFTFDVESAYTKAAFDSDFNVALDEAALGGIGLSFDDSTNTLSIDSAELYSYYSTDNLSEGDSNLYYTTLRADSAFDVRFLTKTTDSLAEGDNLYYTTARADSAFDIRFLTKTTDSLAEGDNLYYTTSRVDSAFDIRFLTKTTDSLAEGDNLYYTTARADSAFDIRFLTKTTDSLAEGDNLYYTTARADSAFDIRFLTKTTDSLSEGDNLYYTTARADSAFDVKFLTKTTDSLGEGTTNLYYTTSRFDSDFNARFDSDFNIKLDTSGLGGINLVYDSTNNTLNMATSGVTAGVYGTSTRIPVLTVDSFGTIDSAGLIAVGSVDSIQYDTTSKLLTIFTSSDDSFSATIPSGGITVKETLSLDSVSESFSEITAIRFDNATGFNVDSFGPGEVKVTLGSSFKTLTVTGESDLVAVGEDTLELIAGTGITLSTSIDSVKSLEISIDSAELTYYSVGDLGNVNIAANLDDGALLVWDSNSQNFESTKVIPKEITFTTGLATEEVAFADSVTRISNITTFRDASTGIHTTFLNTFDSANGFAVKSNNILFLGMDNQRYLRTYDSGHIELYYNSVHKLETRNYGVLVHGQVRADSGQFSGPLSADSATLGKVVATSFTGEYLGFDSDLASSDATQTIRSYFGVDGGLAYDSINGVFSFNVESAYTKVMFDSDWNVALDEAAIAGTGLTFSVDSNTLSIDSAGLAYYKGPIRSFFGVAGGLAYDSINGVFSFNVESAYTKVMFDSDWNQALDEAAIGGTGLTFNADSNKLSIDSAELYSYYSTDNISEGDSNLYYTTARNDSDTRVLIDSNYIQARQAEAQSYAGFDSDFYSKTTDSLSEGLVNLYYTTARADSAFDVKFLAKTTDSLGEGTTNLYYTTARHDSDTIVLVDSAYVNARVSTVDSAQVLQIVDSDYILSATSNTGVDSGVYGSATSVPVLTINAQGKIDSAGTISVAGVSSIAFDSASGIFTINTADGEVFNSTILDSSLTDKRTRSAINLVDNGGDGSLSYDSATGKISYTGPSVAEVHSKFLGKNGVVFDSGNISIDSSYDAVFNSATLNGTKIFGKDFGSLTLNRDQFKGNGSQTVFNVVSDSAGASAVIALGVNNQYDHAIGTIGTAASNDFVLGFSGTTTDFIIKNNVGTTPFDLAGGDTLFTLNKDGKIAIPNDTEATTKTDAAVTITGGLGVDKNIRGEDIIAANNIQSVGGLLLGHLSAASLSNLTTGDLAEDSFGVNRYYTDARVDSHVSNSMTTSDLEEGNNLYYTTARADSAAKRAISVNDGGGDGSLVYVDSTGVFTYTGPTDSDVRAHFAAGTGITFDSSTGVISIGQAVGTGDSIEFAAGSISGNFNISGNLVVGGDYILNQTTDLRVTNALIKLADSNTNDTVDIGVVGRYSQDGGSTIRRSGFFRDASNGEWYTFNNLIQDDLDSNPAATVINRNAASFELGTWNFGALRGRYLGFDSDFRVFSTDYTEYTTDFTAVSAGRYAINTSGGQVTVTLPASPSTGDYIKLIDVGDWTANSVILDRNGSTIEGYSENFELDLGQSIIELIYINSNWQIYSSIGQRGETGPKGDSADAADFSTRAQSIAFAVALG